MNSTLWIARDENGGLYLYSNKPIKQKFGEQNFFKSESKSNDGNYDEIKIDSALFPEVTFENSPQQLVLKQDWLMTVTNYMNTRRNRILELLS